MASGSLRSLRQHNRGRLLSLLAEHGPMHRAELARLTGLSRSAVSLIIGELLAEGAVVALGTAVADGRRGRTGETIALAGVSGVALGIDYSIVDVRVAVATAAHEVLASTVVPLPADARWPERLEAGIAAVADVRRQAGMADTPLLAVGLGIPDPIDLHTGLIGKSRTGPTWTGTHAAEEFAARLGVPVHLDNTAHLAALAESAWGAGAGTKHMVYVKMSHGIGAGLVLDGRVYRGAVGLAGELGHVTVSDEGPACTCGNRGCLELYAGTDAIVAALRPLRGEDLTIEEVIAAAHEGDRSGRRVLEDAGRRMGRALANVCNLLNPELIVIGGELAAAGDLLLEPLRATIGRHALELAANVRVEAATLGPLGGALGGVVLALQAAPEAFVSSMNI